jgi:hypothetical protein
MKKVTEKEVRTIKMLTDKNISRKAICEITGRSESTIKRALHGDYEKHDSVKDDDLHALLEENLNVLAKIEERIKG